LFVDAAVDFMRTYADRTHHGKEEGILFRDLAARSPSAVDRAAMDDLVAEHAWARRMTTHLIDVSGRHRAGEPGALSDIVETLQALVEFYPQHIAKEDKQFFPAARAYFTAEEDQAMIREFFEFDRHMIHEKYKGVVERLLEEEGASD
jgi:hemerythrin-like domain-containing protein